MVYLNNMNVKHLKALAHRLHRRLTGELQAKSKSHHSAAQESRSSQPGFTGLSALHSTFSAAQSSQLNVSPNHGISGWGSGATDGVSQQYPQHLLDDFDRVFPPAPPQRLMEPSLPLPMLAAPTADNRLEGETRTPPRVADVISPLPFLHQSMHNRMTEKWPPTFLSWLSTSPGAIPPEAYDRF